MSQMHNGLDLAETEIDRLHRSMRISGMTSADMAEALGCHRNTITNYMRGHTRMDRRTRIAWAFATGVPLVWLEHGVIPPDDDAAAELPRLDSNQQPSGYMFSLVAA